MIVKLILLAISLVPIVRAESVRTIKLCEKGVATTYISPKGTVLDFPAEPEKVVLGSKGAFSIEYIRNDLAVSPATLGSRSNLFVYLQGRRFSLDLVTTASGATVYFIKDCEIDQVKAKKNGK